MVLAVLLLIHSGEGTVKLGHLAHERVGVLLQELLISCVLVVFPHEIGDVAGVVKEIGVPTACPDHTFLHMFLVKEQGPPRVHPAPA